MDNGLAKNFEEKLEKLAPKAVDCLKDEKADKVIMCNCAFGITDNELMALGLFIKLAGHYKKEVHIIQDPPKDGKKDARV